MAFTISDPGEQGTIYWEPVPRGLYQAVCYALIDLGTQYSDMYATWQHKLWIAWEFPGEKMEVVEDGKSVFKNRIIAEFFTASLSTKGHLRPLLESWRGIGFTQEELAGFNIQKLIGANAMINVIHKPKKDGSMRAVIGSISPIQKGVPKVDSENEYIYYSIEEHGLVIPDGVPEGIKKIIEKSQEFSSFLSMKIENETGQQGQSGSRIIGPDENPWPDPPEKNNSVVVDDDECPF